MILFYFIFSFIFPSSSIWLLLTNILALTWFCPWDCAWSPWWSFRLTYEGLSFQSVIHRYSQIRIHHQVLFLFLSCSFRPCVSYFYRLQCPSILCPFCLSRVWLRLEVYPFCLKAWLWWLRLHCQCLSLVIVLILYGLLWFYSCVIWAYLWLLNNLQFLWSFCLLSFQAYQWTSYLYPQFPFLFTQVIIWVNLLAYH